MAACASGSANWSPDMLHSDRERWICIYPAYINSKKTRQEGRRLPKHQCVDNPTYQEIKDVLAVSNVRVGFENKQYPRERSKELNHRYRVRVQLKTDAGTPVNSDFPTRDSIMVHLGKMIPQLKSRQGAKAQEAQQAQQSTSGAHKKGKGKRR